MPKLTESQKDTLARQTHANVMAVVRVARDQSVVDAAAYSELRKLIDVVEAHGEADSDG